MLMTSLTVLEETMAKIKTVKFRGKVSDRFGIQLKDENGNELLEDSGYMPEWFSPKEYDDVKMEIDNETGKILNWEPIKDDVLEKDEDEF